MAAGIKRDQDQEKRHKQQPRNIKLENEDCKVCYS